MRTSPCPHHRHGEPSVNYTEALTALARDIAARVPELSFIDMDRMLIFARVGRGHVEGAVASCHCLCLPEDEPGYYFWRDERTGEVTRRTEWFVARTPVVQRTGTRLDYLISVALPRFCDQRLGQGRKAALYPGAGDHVAKLDTLVHELYHVDPLRQGMTKTRDAVDAKLPAVHGGKMSAAQYDALGSRIDTQIAYIVQNCKLDPKADAALHVILAGLSEGNEILQGKQAKQKRSEGVVKVVHALEQYGSYFDHPGWRAPQAAH